jgi:hypothetical protein
MKMKTRFLPLLLLAMAVLGLAVFIAPPLFAQAAPDPGSIPIVSTTADDNAQIALTVYQFISKFLPAKFAAYLIVVVSIMGAVRLFFKNGGMALLAKFVQFIIGLTPTKADDAWLARFQEGGTLHWLTHIVDVLVSVKLDVLFQTPEEPTPPAAP